MESKKYVIIGSGMTANAAINAIKSLDASADIVVFGEENSLPYAKPPLSKKLWQGKPLDGIWLKSPHQDVQFYLGNKATKIDTAKKQVLDSKGQTYGYDKLLLATGGIPRKLSFPLDERIIYFRNLDDYKALKSDSEKYQNFGVIGGGFIGSEIAAALAQNGKKVTMLFPEKGINSRIFPEELSGFLNEYYAQKGVRVMASENIEDISAEKDGYVIKTKSGKSVEVERIVAGLGIEPDVALAREAGIAVANGIVVDEYLQTERDGVYAAGDVVNFFNPTLNMRMRLEHEDHAVKSGETAGLNMAGAKTPYTHLPMFYSDLFDLGYEAVGLTSSALESHCVWKEKNRKGVIYYLAEGKVRGVVLWNVWDRVNDVRKIIESHKSYGIKELEGLIPV